MYPYNSTQKRKSKVENKKKDSKGARDKGAVKGNKVTRRRSKDKGDTPKKKWSGFWAYL